MSEFVIDKYGAQIWYDWESAYDNNIATYPVRTTYDSKFYVRPHREDGPAITFTDGSEFYFISGKKHRENGPAIICSNYRVEWWLNNRNYYFWNWCKELNKSEEEINFLRLKYNV